MGCGCGGSTRRTEQPAQRDGKATPIRERRGGGPGQEGYYWNGPKRAKKTPPTNPGPAAA